ncbi:MAG: hypothetical protein MUO63_19130 [Desulfobulbaceae bacterium]|nr:hypothetical protein [Desulfobulbaceae bacterium]
MDKPLKALIVGLLLGATVAVVSWVKVDRYEDRLKELRVACEKESETSGFSKFGGTLICDPAELVSISNTPPGIQGELVAAQQALRQWKETGPFASGIIILLLGLPWAWYFLLSRLRELREALIGK